MKTQLLLVGAIGLTLSACSSKSGNQGSKKTTMAREAYQFELNGCNTGLQEFVHSSADEARRMMCETLQNDDINKGCAEFLRRDHFESKCSGVFTSVSPSREEARRQEARRLEERRQEEARRRDRQRQDSRSEEPGEIRDRENEFALLRYVNGMALEKVTINPNLKNDLKVEAEALAAVAEDCGINASGVRCDRARDMLVKQELLFIGGKRVYISIMNYNFALVMPVESISPVRIKEIEYRKIIKSPHYKNLAEYIQTPSNFVTLFTATVADDAFEANMSKALNAANIRQLYHGLHDPFGSILMNEARIARLETVAARALAARAEVIYSSVLPDYQIKMIRLINTLKKLSPEIKMAIFTRLTASADKNVKQLASAEVLLLEPKRQGTIREAVLAGMDNSDDYELRLRCIEATLNAENISSEMRAKLFQTMGDRSEYVRGIVIKKLQQFPLGSHDVPVLKSLLQSENYDTRLAALEMLARIPGEEAGSAVLGQLESEASEYVRKQAYNSFKQRGVKPEDVPALSKLLSINTYDVREFAANQLNEIAGDRATVVLIKAMNDSSEYIRGVINKLLQKRPMPASALPDLKKNLRSDNYDVRENSAVLISKIETREALHILIGSLNDPSEYVRAQNYKLVSAKQLSAEEVPVLSPLLNNDNYDVRERAANLLGKIKDPSSLKALEERLKIEPSDYIKGVIRKAIEKVK